MKQSFLKLIVLMGAFPALLSAAGSEETDRMENAIKVLEEATVIPDKTIPHYLFGKAEGVAIIPGVIKGALGIGGRRGEGVMSVRTAGGHWSDPAFVSLTGGSVGWQIGVESSDLVLIFRTKRSIQGVENGKIVLGADASVAAGPVGRNAEANTDAQLRAEILSYAKGRGLFAGASIQGSALEVDNTGNVRFYKVSDINIENIFAGKIKNPPSSVARLKRLLATLSDGIAAGASPQSGDSTTAKPNGEKKGPLAD